ncbi:hypothetical protein [Paenibacillus sp. OK003]|uniref:hypothetical protein n=1 Tax=Paenibacillus sp. OK003 TaxID=1884380 RepID=UPI0008C81DBF|nr:hypothetical protein [Paenibacillus sp. OK003]SEK25175.1 hypothetical protein SAMN05518856_101262 [Paenibacillus sp. OK003]
MVKKSVTTLFSILIVVVLTGCLGQPNVEPSLNSSSQELVVKEKIEESEAGAFKPSDIITEEEKEEELTHMPDAHTIEGVELSILVGDEVKLETSLEHEKVTVDGMEYSIKPYGVTFGLRKDMGEPVVKDEKIVFTTDLSGEAIISYEVIENTTLNEAVERELQDREGSFYGEFIETNSNGGLKGKHNQYKDDSVFSGVFYYEFDRHVLRIEYRCVIASVDVMVRIINETVDSVKKSEW